MILGQGALPRITMPPDWTPCPRWTNSSSGEKRRTGRSPVNLSPDTARSAGVRRDHDHDLARTARSSFFLLKFQISLWLYVLPSFSALGLYVLYSPHVRPFLSNHVLSALLFLTSFRTRLLS